MKKTESQIYDLLQNIKVSEYTASEDEVCETVNRVMGKIDLQKPKSSFRFKWAYGLAAAAACVALVILSLPIFQKPVEQPPFADTPTHQQGQTITALEFVKQSNEYGVVQLSSRNATEVLDIVRGATEELDWDYILEGKTESPNELQTASPDVSSLPNVYEDAEFLYWFNDDGSLFARILLDADAELPAKNLSKDEAVEAVLSEIEKYKANFNLAEYTLDTTQNQEAHPAWRITLTKSVDGISVSFIDAQINEAGRIGYLLFDDSKLLESAIKSDDAITDDAAIMLALDALAQSEYKIDLSDKEYEVKVTRSALSDKVTCYVEFSLPATWNPEATQLYLVELDAETGDIIRVDASR